jgi:hypothetical protein
MQDICFPAYGSRPPAQGETISLRGHNTSERGILTRARVDVHIAGKWQRIETVQHTWKPPVQAWPSRQPQFVKLQVPLVTFGTVHPGEYREALQVLTAEMAGQTTGYVRSQGFLFTYVSPLQRRLLTTDPGH